jgi:hypothetical protein
VPYKPEFQPAFVGFAMLHDWLMTAIYAEDPETGCPEQLVWEKADGRSKSTFHLVTDPFLGFLYLVARGKEALDEVSEMERNVRLVPEDELLKDARRAALPSSKSPKKSILALWRLGVAAPEKFDERFFEFLVAALAHPRVEVRRAAAYVTGYPGWIQFRAPLSRLARADRDAEVRRDARRMVRAMDEVHGPKKR